MDGGSESLNGGQGAGARVGPYTWLAGISERLRASFSACPGVSLAVLRRPCSTQILVPCYNEQRQSRCRGDCAAALPVTFARALHSCIATMLSTGTSRLRMCWCGVGERLGEGACAGLSHPVATHAAGHALALRARGLRIRTEGEQRRSHVGARSHDPLRDGRGALQEACMRLCGCRQARANFRLSVAASLLTAPLASSWPLRCSGEKRTTTRRTSSHSA